MPSCYQHGCDVAANGADIASGTGHEDRPAMLSVHRHVGYLCSGFADVRTDFDEAGPGNHQMIALEVKPSIRRTDGLSRSAYTRSTPKRAAQLAGSGTVNASVTTWPG